LLFEQTFVKPGARQQDLTVLLSFLLQITVIVVAILIR